MSAMEHKEFQLPRESDVVADDLEIISINAVCRLCGHHCERLIGIFSEEGVSSDLANKINIYLPVKVSTSDDLPLQCCWTCASTLLAWHDFVAASVESDRKFRSCHFVNDKPVPESFQHVDNTTTDDENHGLEAEPSLNDFCQTEVNQELIDPNKESIKPLNPKKKEDDVTFYPPVETSNTFETYISDIEHHFIVNSELNENPENINEYKINIDQEHALTDEDNKDDDVKDLDCLNPVDVISMKSEEDNLNTFYACKHCSVVFVMERDVLSHIEKDHPGKEFLITPIPDTVPNRKSSNSKKERRRNNKIDQDVTNAAKVVVDGRIYYNCKECGKSLHSPYTYVWHMRIHTGERPYVCDLCGKQFRVSQGLIRHLRETHEGIKKFPCDLCGRLFATRRNVEEHRRIHTNERPYVCDLCGKSFKQKASLFVHKRSHKNYFPFKCSYCNQGFRTKPPLMVHITRHTGEKPYKCDICGRCFRIKYELKRHKLIHSDEKPFICNLCGLTFRQKRYLRNHTKSNHAVTPS